ncbi:30S ribosomal protein S13 [Candidatus Termititenax persephonae]|uniref:Small ribosomal subunit protein uS13 n=1 Tax=Candidatus Termititenax persephonae TaxID=2218525 RepID=A0A388TIE2_9BACT|nr:30S ribosomal protein S13 [Candidatus Termititenax persephonae]
MARLAGVDLPNNKRIDVALRYIYGIGEALSGKILKAAEVRPEIRVKDLAEADVVKLRDVLRDYVVEGDLRRKVTLDVKRLIEIGSYRGQRHRKGLPCHGQRSRTNARTNRKGPKRTVANKKVATK